MGKLFSLLRVYRVAAERSCQNKLLPILFADIFKFHAEQKDHQLNSRGTTLTVGKRIISPILFGHVCRFALILHPHFGRATIQMWLQQLHGQMLLLPLAISGNTPVRSERSFDGQFWIVYAWLTEGISRIYQSTFL